jgi:hypothetical protein
VSDDRGHITWPALLDAGLTHVDVLNRGSHDASEWVVRSSRGEALVRITLNVLELWVVECFVPVSHHAGAPSSAGEWQLEDTRTYLGGQVSLLLDDVAAIVG